LWVLPGDDSRFYTRGPGSGVLQTEPGKNIIRVVVKDAAGNAAEFKAEFTL
jgi:hypothetical protein